MRSRETGSGAGKSRASPVVTYLWLSASLSVCAPLTGALCGLAVALLWWMFSL